MREQADRVLRESSDPPRQTRTRRSSYRPPPLPADRDRSRPLDPTRTREAEHGYAEGRLTRVDSAAGGVELLSLGLA